MSMDYKINSITARAGTSSLWKDVETQSADALPYLLERYLLLENWRYRDRLEEPEPGRHISADDVQFLHTLIAESVTVLLSQEERIRQLEHDMLAISAIAVRSL